MQRWAISHRFLLEQEKNVYGAELAVVVDKIIPANEIEDNWK